MARSTCSTKKVSCVDSEGELERIQEHLWDAANLL